MKKTIQTLIEKNALIADKAVRIGDCNIFRSAGDGKVYVHNKKTNRAYAYDSNGENCKQMTLEAYNTQVSALQARMKAEAAKAEREKVAQWQAQHGESKTQDGRAKETNKTEEDKFPSMDEIALRSEERWIGTPDKTYIWPVGSFVKVRMVEKEDSRVNGRIIADKYLEDGAYRFQFEEVRSVNGVAVETGKSIWFALKADQKTVDSFKNAINKRYDNFIWKKLNEGVEHKWECKKVTTVDLSVFFEYLVKFPIKILYDHTEWVDQDTNQVKRSAKPKVRLWLPGDFDNNDNRQYQNTKATR